MQQFYFYILDKCKRKYTYTELKSVYCTTIITNNMLLMQAHFRVTRCQQMFFFD